MFILLIGGNSRAALFCEDNHSHYRETYQNFKNFPTDVPNNSFTPWVWDAVHHGERNVLEITIIPISACSFDKNLWQEAVNDIPDQKYRLADGLSSNILVPVAKEHLYLFRNFTKNYPQSEIQQITDRLDESHVMLHETPICKFHRFGKLIYTSLSEKIFGKLPYLKQGTVQVVCPSPPEKFDGVSLLRNFIMMSSTGSSVLIQYSKESDVFVPCSAKKLNKKTETKSKNKAFKISLCTASARIFDVNFVEWIEYHRLIGVNHFFVYNTALSSRHLKGTLKHYIDIGLVTLIQWPYNNCVKGMGGGRWLHWKSRNSTLGNDSKYFRPPVAISQTAALASCYSRYRSTSKYIVHIDDDEFITLSGSTQSRSPDESLLEFVEKLFADYPDKVAIGFRQVSKYHCPTKGKGSQSFESTIELPRVGRWQHTQRGEIHESKLIMKTDSVRMFYVHYLSQVEPRLGHPSLHTALSANMTDAVLLHYRVPSETSGDIFGGHVANGVKKGTCDQRLLKKGHEDYNRLLSIKHMIRRISPHLQALLKINYRAVMVHGKS